MAGLSKYETAQGVRWRVEWRWYDGTRGSHSFLNRSDAAQWKARIEVARSNGSLVDEIDQLKGFPNVGDLQLRDLIDRWKDEWVKPELSEATASSYVTIYNRWIADQIGEKPISAFETPGVINEWRVEIVKEGASDSVVKRATSVLSSALSFGLDLSPPALQANGALSLSTNKRRRKKTMSNAPQKVRGVALSPYALEVVRRVMQARRPGTSGHMDSVIVAVHYMSGCRSQDLWALRWKDVDLDAGWLHFENALIGKQAGRSLGAGKTGSHAAPVGGSLKKILEDWKATFDATRPNDFVFPGAHELGHMTTSQARNWRNRQWTPAVEIASEICPDEFELAELDRTTPYSCRRSFITLALRAHVDPNEVANWCGTSVEMLYRHYSQLIKGLQGQKGKTLEAAIKDGIKRASVASVTHRIENHPDVVATKTHD